MEVRILVRESFKVNKESIIVAHFMKEFWLLKGLVPVQCIAVFDHFIPSPPEVRKENWLWGG